MERSRIALPIGITLDRFIKSKQDEYPTAAGEFSQLLRDIALASKVVNREINKAGLVDIMGYIGQQNKAGDDQQKLDVLAHIRFRRAFSKGGEARRPRPSRISGTRGNTSSRSIRWMALRTLM